MQIHTIGPAVLVLRVNREELLRRGWELPPGLREVLLLAGEACRETGRPPECLAEIEASPLRQGLLIFLRLEPPKREWFVFPDLTAALDGLCALSSPPTGKLAWEAEDCCLSTEREDDARVLSEFGRVLEPERCAMLEKQGTPVLGEEELTALWERLKKR